MADTGTTQDNFILPAPPVGLPISQDWFDRMKLVHDRTIPIILPRGRVDLTLTARQAIVGLLKCNVTVLSCHFIINHRKSFNVYLTTHSTHF